MSTNENQFGSRASYTWRIEGALIVIEDQNQDRSVTNDAERVIADLVAMVSRWTGSG